MPDFARHLLLAWPAAALAVLAGTAVLHALPRLGDFGRRASAYISAGFPLDCVVFYLTALPALAAAAWGGWGGLVGGVLGMYTALIGWTLLHELRHRKTRGRAAILGKLNDVAGPVRNIASVYWTALAVPVFTIVRAAEWLIYPPLTWTIKLPRYDSRQWVNVTRHKVDGLVGHDRAWCLYCDWMTGVWSMGSEMLRNIETFWCPIRFGDKTKCANCANDFPDVREAWVPFEAGPVAAAEAIGAHCGDRGESPVRTWWGHPDHKPVKPVKLTVNGHDLNGHGANGRADAAAGQRTLPMVDSK